MKEFKGTKGEWNSAGYSEDSNGFISVEFPKGHITVYGGCTEGMDEKETKEHIQEAEANAKLIAAAPELLEACYWVVTDFEGDYMVDGEIVDNPSETLISNYIKAKKAIQKALGNENK